MLEAANVKLCCLKRVTTQGCTHLPYEIQESILVRRCSKFRTVDTLVTSLDFYHTSEQVVRRRGKDMHG